MEKGLWHFAEASRGAHQRVGPPSSCQWGHLSFTVRGKHSFQSGPSDGLNGDLGSFGERAFRIAAPGAFGHELQFARGCNIFHSSTRVLPDGPQSGRWSQLPWLKMICAAPLERRWKRQRATIGLLRDRLIAPRTLVKYRASTAAFCGFCSNAGYPKPHTATEMDLRLCEFGQHAWEEGDSRNIPAEARSGLMHFIDGHLPGNQRQLWARSKNELPERSDPLPINLLLAMVCRF